MKIAFFVEIFPKLSETFILNQITGLIDRGHSVEIYAFTNNEDEISHPDIHGYNLLDRTRFFDTIPRTQLAFVFKAMGMMVRHFPWLPIRVTGAIYKAFRSGVRSIRSRTIRELFLMPKDNQYDIIHCQFGKLGPPVLELRRFGAISGKLVTSFRGYDATTIIDQDPNYYSKLFKDGDLFFPVSNSLKKRLLQAGCDPARIIIHRSGVDCSKFSFKEPKFPEDGPVRLLTIGRLVEKKGITYAIQTIAKLRKHGFRVIYTVIGDGDLRLQLEQLVQDLDLKNEVKLIGWRDHEDVVRFLRQSHILIAPSVEANGDHEGIPNSLKEAMAMGLPVIGTRHGGIPELIDDGVSGFLVPERDVEALVDRLRFLIDHPEIWSAMGRCGSKIVYDNYEIEMLNDNLVGHYRDLL